MVVGARFAAWRAGRLRLVVMAALAAIAYGVVRLVHPAAAAPATDAILLGLIVLCAAIVGFPFAASAALLAVLDYAARAGLYDGAAISSAVVVGNAGLLLSPLFTTSPAADADGAFYDPGQVAFGLERARCASAARELRSDCERHLNARFRRARSLAGRFYNESCRRGRCALRLAVALNELIFGMREFLRQLHDNARRLGDSGEDLGNTASTALAVIEGAPVAQGQLDEGIREQSNIVETATRKVQALTETINSIAASAEQQTGSLDETALAVPTWRRRLKKSPPKSGFALRDIARNLANRRAWRHSDLHDRR